jgi:asparagine synthase (glutamine-hydrolysing)
MCGIAGELNWTAGANRQAVDAMVSGISHRGPDDRGLWSSPNGACALGHARLSVIDLSAAGHQPMVDPETGNAIVFNGEIYNFQLLRKECESSGDVLRSRSDTEVILTLYRRFGLDCLRLLRGMFALVIWDEQRQQFLLARDRIGKKPLNYAITPAGIAFCSELHPLSRYPGVDDGMDFEALELYLQCQFIPAPWTIYRGIRKLPPAHYAVCDRNGAKLHKYWEIDYNNKIRISEADALDALEEQLTEAIRLRMIADVPLGALLSGGVDSSVVVALMSKISIGPVRTFSIGFEAEASNELPWAQQAAERCGTQHHPVVVKGDVEPMLGVLARHYGEPYADDSAVPSFAVSKLAQRHVTVAMNGDGGDELMGGYQRYWLSNAALASSALLGGLISPERLADLAPRLQDARSVPGRVVRKLLMHHANPELASVLMFADFWPDTSRNELLPDRPRTLMRDWWSSWLEQASAHADNAIDRMLWLDNHTYLPGCLLVKMDIAAMHCGLETRSPLLDHKVIEFCARLPVRYKVRHRSGKYLLKKLAERHFPAELVHRPKRGFSPPLVDWLRGPLRNVLREMLLDDRLMGPLAVPVIARTLREFEAGRGGHERRLWALLMFGSWRLHRAQST